jgi:hypothetical protein
MSIPGSVNPLFLGAAGQATGGGEYQIERSVRFNSPDSAYLSRTPGSASNRKTWTWAGWVKRSGLGSNQKLFIAGTSGNEGGIQFYSGTGNDAIELYDYGGAYSTQLDTSQLFRDASAWYHILVAYDTTQATASNRVKLFINGSQVTAFATATYPSQNYDGFINNNISHAIGAISGPSGFYNGYLADIHFIDGQALDPSSFGEFDTNGVWQPLSEVNVNHGVNGFHLLFSDNSTAAALGTDTSGNSNTWTVNNISVTAGAGNDSLVDSPVNGSQVDTGVGGEVVGNYATLNRADPTTAVLTNGNLDCNLGSSTLRPIQEVRLQLAQASGTGNFLPQT